MEPWEIGAIWMVATWATALVPAAIGLVVIASSRMGGQD